MGPAVCSSVLARSGTGDNFGWLEWVWVNIKKRFCCYEIINVRKKTSTFGTHELQHNKCVTLSTQVSFLAPGLSKLCVLNWMNNAK